MHGRTRWWLGVAVGLALLPAVARADTGSEKNSDERSQSHITIPLHGMDLQKALAERMQVLKDTAKAREYFQDLLKNLNQMDQEKLRQLKLDQEKLSQLTELFDKGRFPFKADDPLFQELKKDYAEKNLLPDQRKQLDQFIKKVEGDSQPLRLLEGVPSPFDGNSQPMSPGDIRLQQGQPAPDLRGHPPMPGPPTESEDDQNFLQKLASDLAERLEMEGGSWADSPALRDAVREFKRPHLELGDWSGLDEKSWSGKLAGFSRSLVQSRFWPEVDWSRLGKLWSPKLPARQIDMPKIKAPWKAPAASGFPKISLPSPSSLNRGLGVLWVALVVLLVVIVWKFLRSQSTQARQASRAWKLGPWPVSPAAVASREELILAFEYLSLLKLGPAARSRNHLALAEALAGKREDYRQAARHLAALYELARYAPDRDPLSDDALLAARRELCFLAETAG